jgi:cytidylate kinase
MRGYLEVGGESFAALQEASMSQEKKDPVHWEKLIGSRIAPWEVRKLHPEGRAPEGPWQKMNVTLSRRHGAGGDAVAAALGQLTGWAVYDRELVDFIAENAHVHQRVVSTLDERRLSETEIWMRTLIDSGAMAPDKYLKHLLKVLASLFAHGQTIVVGRGAHLVVNPEQAVRVLITAPLEWRTQRLMEKRGIDKREAQKVITDVDATRAAFIRRYFHVDTNDHTIFDLVINSEHTQPQQAARIILCALEQRAGEPFPEPAAVMA